MKTKIAFVLAGLLCGSLLAYSLISPSKEEVVQAMYQTTETELEYWQKLYNEKQSEADELKVKVEFKQKELSALRSVLEALSGEIAQNLNRDALINLLAKYNSPINADEYIKACSKYPTEMCKTFVGIMVHESRLCTAFYLPAIEKDYHNCSGWKSEEILKTHQPDKNGSWLQRFDSYQDYYEKVLPRFYAFYWQQNLRSPEQIVKKYVGKYSHNWVNTVATTIINL